MINWYEVTAYINGKITIYKTTESLEEAEFYRESLKQKGIETKILRWKIENGKSILIGEL